MSNKNFKGSVELISGITPKGGADFPLVDAEDIIIYDGDDDTEGMRLPEKLKNVGISAEEKQTLVTEAVNKTKTELAQDLAQITTNKDNITNQTSQISKNKTEINEIKNTLKTLENDNPKLYLNYTPGDSVLTLYNKNPNGDVDFGDEGRFDYITSTTIVGGGGSGGNVATYKLSFKTDPDFKENFTILQGQEVKLKYQIKLSLRTDELDDKGNNIYTDITSIGETVKFSIYKNNNYQGSITETLTQPKGEIDVTKYASIGTNTFKIVASIVEYLDNGEITETKSTAYWGVEVVTMKLTVPNTEWEAEPKYGSAPFNYSVEGDLEKTVYFKLNGNIVHQETVLASQYSGVYNIVPDILHGMNTLEVYCEGQVEGETISSPVHKFVLLFVDSSSTQSLIRIKTETNIEQYSSSTIYFNVIDPDPKVTSIAEVKIYENDVLQTTFSNIFSTEQKWEYKPTTPGEKTIRIDYLDKASESVVITVAKFPYEISPASSEWLQIDFSPVGRSNQDIDYNIFKNNTIAYEPEPEKEGEKIEKPIDWTLSPNFDWINGGWKKDANGDSYFCIKAGTWVDINYPLFATNNTVAKKQIDPATLKTKYTAGSGKEMKIVFKTENVADAAQVWLKCMEPAANGSPTGIEMKAHEAIVNSSENKPLTIPYSEEDIIEFDMNITPVVKFTDDENGIADLTTKDIPMIMTYEDGTPVQPRMITNSSIGFKQENPAPIHIGSDYCDVHIYRLKVYERFLSEKEILNNFIADARSGSEMANRFVRNQIYRVGSSFTNNEADLEYLAKACPNLRVFLVSAPLFTIDKDDKVKNTTIKQWYYGEGEESPYRYWKADNSIHRGQGTSSNKYGYAGRNLDFDMKKATITDANGQILNGIPFTENSVPTKYMNFKINIASSENANNAILANRYNRYLPYVPYATQRDERAKTTMEFQNCVVFIQETKSETTVVNGEPVKDFSSHKTFSDDAIHFYGIGNIGDSKKTDSTRTSDPDDENEFCVEIVDWNQPLSAFPENPYLDASTLTYTKDNQTFYHFYNEEGLKNKILEELIDGEYVVSQDTEIQEGKTYYVNMLEHDDFSGDFTYEFRYITEYDEDDELPAEELAANKEHNKRIQTKAKTVWKNFYKFLTRDLTTNGKEDPAKVEEWKEEFKEWFILDAAVYYYLFTLRYTMVDNRAKNSFYHYGKVGEDAEGNPIYKFDFWDYDNDTSLGIDNAGKLEMSYGVEDLDTDALGNLLFRAGNSTFFTRVAKYFGTEIQEMYNELEKAEAFNSQNLISEFDNWQSQFPEELWRLDYERRYKRTYVGGTGVEWDNALPKLDENGKFVKGGEKRFLEDMMNGKKKYQRRQFERNQGFYMGSKYVSQGNQGDFMQFRGAGAGASYDPPQDCSLTITPYLNMYINLHDGTKVYCNQKVKAGEPFGPIKYGGTYLDILNIYGASNIQSFGDASLLYPQTASLDTGKKLKTVILGNEDEKFDNPVLQNISLGVNNKLLEVLDIRNISGLKGALDSITEIPSLKYLYAQGTNVTGAKFANNGLLREAYLPATLTDLECRNLFFLEKLEIESYEKLTNLVIENCDIETQPIVEAAIGLKTAIINNINWNLNSFVLLERLYKRLTFKTDGSSNNEIILSGYVKLIGTITEYDLAKYRSVWPNLTIQVGSKEDGSDDESLIIKQQWVRFWSDFSEDKVLLTEFLVNREEFLETKQLGQVKTTYDPTIEGNLSGQLIPVPMKPNSKDGQFIYRYLGWRGLDPQGSPTIPLVDIKIENQDIDIFATYSEIKRTYRVSWLNGDNSEIAYLPGVEFGASVKYEEAYDSYFDTPTIINSGKLPVKNPQTSTYYLFTGWKESTAYVVPRLNSAGTDYLDVIEIHPIFVEQDAYNVTGGNTEQLKAIDLYAVNKHAPDRMNSTIFDLKNSAAKDKIQIQLGYMPSFEGIEEEIIIGEKAKDPNHKEWVCDGVTIGDPSKGVLVTDIHPFAEDQSFVLAIDFTATHNGNGEDGSSKYLISAYDPVAAYGFNLITANNTTPLLKWGDLGSASSATQAFIPSKKGTTVDPQSTIAKAERYPRAAAANLWDPALSHREICVIRKKRGDTNLYVYTNKKYENEEIQEHILIGAINKTLENSPLILGAGVSSLGTFTNLATGIIHNVKIWWDDLGEAECKKICVWTYEKMNFIYSNSNNSGSYTPRYYYENKRPCSVSFIAETLLPEQVTYHKGGGTNNKKNYHETTLKSWLTNKFMKAFPLDWQQTINPVKVPALGNYINGEFIWEEYNGVLPIMEEYDKLYIPSALEVDVQKFGGSSAGSYALEATQTGGIVNGYPQFFDPANRVYKLPGTDVLVPWALRTYHTDRPGYRASVQISDKPYPEEGFTGGAISYRQKYQVSITESKNVNFDLDYNNFKYGILVGFSI